MKTIAELAAKYSAEFIVEPMEWRLVPGWPRYEVSECGDLRSARPDAKGRRRRFRGYVDIDGYLRYALRRGDGSATGVPAHRLVAEAFIGPAPSPRHEVAHCNGSRVACHYKLLRWALRRENHADIQAHETSLKGERNGRAKITEADVRAIRREYRRIKAPGSGRSVAELDDRFGLCRATIIDIAKGNSWRHVPFEEEELAA